VVPRQNENRRPDASADQTQAFGQIEQRFGNVADQEERLGPKLRDLARQAGYGVMRRDRQMQVGCKRKFEQRHETPFLFGATSVCLHDIAFRTGAYSFSARAAPRER
jgi:hypothetical protein